MTDINDLYRKFLKKQCSAEEAEQLLRYFREQPHSEEILELMQAELDSPEDFSETQADQEAISANYLKLKDALQTQDRPTKLSRFSAVYKIAGLVAACLLIALLIVPMLRQKSNTPDSAPIVQTKIITPGGNRATLTLTDGSTIALSENKEGIIIGNEITYTDGTGIPAAMGQAQTESRQLILATPKGGQYHITLADGTKVYLNAKSCLSYPDNFDKDRREVTLSGEAYFEVAPDAKRPFIVLSADQQVTVLGTKFNINAYAEDRQTTTTLLEGKIALKGAAYGIKPLPHKILKPGDQAVLSASGLQLNTIDATEAIGWKNGKFIFNSTDIHTVMRQIERWYDVEAVYKDKLPDMVFTGSISKYEDINDVLRKIALTENVRFEIKERRIMVSRK
ncbi:FecR domain-containing protein [Sphingobacterium sp.]|uniref:FecR family protein n=1 Tax=Sphingobacterium sp. TaxID=341027 RepID=UPI002899C979|nr:FecR domain-containing protein [Sphingobacterium sp.]